MPVLLAGLEPDHVTRTNLFDRSSVALCQTATEDDDQPLPNGCVCQAVRAPGSKVTAAPAVRAGAYAWNKGSIRTVPVNHSEGPLPDGCEPQRLISIFDSSLKPEEPSTTITSSAAPATVSSRSRAARRALPRSCRAASSSMATSSCSTDIAARARRRSAPTLNAGARRES